MPYQQTVITVREELKSIFDALDKRFVLHPKLCRYKTSPEQWCIAKILEHITLFNRYFIRMIRWSSEKAIEWGQIAPITGTESDLGRIRNIGDINLCAWLQPSNSLTLVEIREQMRSQVQELLDLLEQMPNGEGSIQGAIIGQLGRMDIYEWLFFLAQHARRHEIEITRVVQAYDPSENP
jgi:hypothetical protein